jgi:signal transduction histidine kinase
MRKLSDAELIEELKQRFEEKEKALYDLRVMTRSLEKVNRKLQDSESLKTNFLSNIKNEINNPLTSILGLSQQLAKSLTLDLATVNSVAGMIYGEAFSLDFQLRNIFSAAELEAGEEVVAVATVDIIHLLSNAIESFKPRADEKRVDIKLIYDWMGSQNNELSFKTDPGKLQIIFMNVLANAIEFNVEDGHVEVKVFKEAAELVVSVEDSGIGIDKADQEIIFDRFVQLDSGTTKSHRGHGLGLSITRALLDFINGRIHVKSTKDKGSVFQINIPESTAAAGADIFSSDGNEFMFDDDDGKVI